MPINLEVTRHFSVVWLECRHLALKVVEWKASRHPTGLGHPVRNELGSSPGPIYKKVSDRRSNVAAFKFRYSQPFFI